jgi:hypothetical protein
VPYLYVSNASQFLTKKGKRYGTIRNSRIRGANKEKNQGAL